MKIAGMRDVSDLGLLAIERGLSCFSRDNVNVAKALGGVSYNISGAERKMVAERLTRNLGDTLSPQKLEVITRGVFEHRWIEREIVWLKRFSSSPQARKIASQGVQIEGMEHLHQSHMQGRGVILWENPLGNRMLGKVALLERGFHLCQLHGSQHGGSESLLGQKVVRGIYRKAETRLFGEVIDIDDDSLGYLRRVVKRLRQNCVVCVSALGEVGRKFISLELLNTRHYFATGVVSLARMSGAALVPLFCLREADGQYRLFLEKPIALGNEGDEATAQAIAQYVRLLESYIRRYPEQWSRWYFPLFSPQEQGAVIDVNV